MKEVIIETHDLTVSDDGDDDCCRAFILLKPHQRTGIVILAYVKSLNQREIHIQELGHRLLNLLD